MRIQNSIKNLTRAAAALGIGLAACAGVIVAGGQAQAGVPSSVPSAAHVSKIDPLVLQETSDGKSASVMVLLSERANLAAAHGMHDQDAQGWYVYNTLRSHAERTQAGLRAYLSSQGLSYRPFWVTNAIEVTGDRALMESLAARPDVAKIESNRPQRWIEDPELATRDVTNTSIPFVPEWGVTNVNAPQVWAMGYTGQGMVVGGQDTGIRWTHLAIKNQYRGWDGANANHNYNWWDSIHTGGGICGPNSQVPCDDNSHGTHTIGTSVGDDGTGNQIGVAPGAEWIGCRNMDQGNGTPATYTECFQFMIAPTDLTGSNPNPALRPHVLVNSWSCPTSEGCAPDTLQSIIEATDAAGIFVQFSAGNAGPSCGTVNTPGAIYQVSFTTGAYNISNALAGFSSRGPVTVDGSNRLKPNISAPGVNVRSATNGTDTSYSNFNGTSMAGPHVSGVVALLWSARPALVRDNLATKNILQDSANPNITVTANPPYCGDTPPTQIPNNYFGYGRVDALAAVNLSGATPTPTVPAATNTPVPPTVTPVIPTNTPGATPTACTLTFIDVPTTHTFYNEIRCLACRGVLGGYADGTFRPGADITRGQISKVVSNAAGFNEPVSGQTFEDVPSSNTFYEWIERLTARGVMSGYACGGSGEPCVPPDNRPYFRPGANATRGQLSKIVSNAAGIIDPVIGLYYEDVPITHTFYVEIMRLTARGVMSGYACGGPGEPCVPPDNRPYFRPGANVTRGQASKIVANTFFPNCSTPQR